MSWKWFDEFLYCRASAPIVLAAGLLMALAGVGSPQRPKPIVGASTDEFGGHPMFPNSELTPGAMNPAVTQETIRQTICIPGYTATIRNVTEAEKKAVMKRYGLPLTDLKLVEIDHFYSLEIGGSNDVSNLWPEYYLPIRFAPVK